MRFISSFPFFVRSSAFDFEQRKRHILAPNAAALQRGPLQDDVTQLSDAGPTLSDVEKRFRMMDKHGDYRHVITPIGTVPEAIPHYHHLRIKESDRIAALVSEINRIGVLAEEAEDGLVITGGEPHGAAIETYNDHRIAMSFAIAGLVAPGMRITNPQCVNKSFPVFWDELEKLTHIQS